MGAEFTREDMVDAVATAISGSMDLDWTMQDGAEDVVRNCGLFELYEALLCARNSIDHALNCPARANLKCQCGQLPLVEQINAALAKVRGER